MNGRDDARAATPAAHAPLADAATVAGAHALTWLVAGNAVGLLLAVLLAWPAAGDLLGALTYGRWVPVHLDVQLYGWTSLPVVGLLLRWVAREDARGRLSRLAVHAWSAAVLAGAVSWLAGGSSGKLFLEWSGASRVALVVAMALLEAALVVALLRRPRERWTRADVLPALVVTALAPLPGVLAWATSPDVYPAINPDSGGATGGSLMGSTLGMVAIVALVPLLAAHFGAFLLLDHGNHSHHEPAQIVGLASVAIWIPLLARHLSAFEWPHGARRWLAALAAWGVALVATGLVAFLPGLLERAKFTDSLVGHAHVALAGFVTTLGVVVLVALDPSGPLARAVDDRLAFVAWHAGLATHVVALGALGVIEQADAGALLRPDPGVNGLLALRVASGAVMLLASLRWASRAWAALAVATGSGRACEAAPAELAA